MACFCHDKEATEENGPPASEYQLVKECDADVITNDPATCSHYILFYDEEEKLASFAPVKRALETKIFIKEEVKRKERIQIKRDVFELFNQEQQREEDEEQEEDMVE